MSVLSIYPDSHSVFLNAQENRYTEFTDIERELNNIGVQFERWQANCQLAPDAGQDSIISAYQESIEKLKRDYGFQSVDVINMNPSHPQKTELRQKFLAEHIHEDFEVRFFIEGCGLFYLHIGGKVYVVLCEKGDLISVPANTPHWFDMGENPSFKCIRLFTTPEGWVANFTGNDISQSFPKLEEIRAELLQ